MRGCACTSWAHLCLFVHPTPAPFWQELPSFWTCRVRNPRLWHSTGTAAAARCPIHAASAPPFGDIGAAVAACKLRVLGGAEERQQGGFGQDTPCHVPLASLQDDERLAGPITEPPWGRMGPPAPVPFTCPFPSPNHAPMGAPQTPQEPGTPSPALTRLLQGGEMRTSPLPNEIRRMSRCSWPPRIIASS